jgi:hypothetical protein
MDESESRYLVLELVEEGRLTADEAMVLLLALGGREEEAASRGRQLRQLHAAEQAQEARTNPWSGVVCI